MNEGRYYRHPLGEASRPHDMFEYYVSGRGQFPFDMLRYDNAWPATAEDADRLERVELRSIKLYSYQKPTLERWASFLWSVGKENL